MFIIDNLGPEDISYSYRELKSFLWLSVLFIDSIKTFEIVSNCLSEKIMSPLSASNVMSVAESIV